MPRQKKQHVIPSTPADRDAVKEAIKQMSQSMTRIDAERDHQKAIIDEICEKYALDKGFFKRASKEYHTSTFEQKTEVQSEYETFYETLAPS